MQDYLKAPHWESAETLDKWLRTGKIFIHNVARNSKKDLTDNDLRATARKTSERNQVETAIRRRDKRWNILKPLIVKTDKASKQERFLSAMELLANPKKLSQAVAMRARSAKCSIATVYNLLHLYWSGGSKKNALFTGHDRCGSKGHSRAQNNSQGARTRLNKAGVTLHRCYILDRGKGRDSHKAEDSEKQKLAWGYRLIKHGMTREDAFLAVSGVHWADHVPDGKGGTRAVLWPAHERPTFNQFLYWGRALNGGLLVAEAMLGAAKLAQKSQSRGGSQQDMVTTVGQLAVFDGTKTDVYLTSRHNRIKKLPPMLRLIIKDVRTDVICGWYLGWEAASPQTAIQAIFHAACSKVEEGRSLGIEVTDEKIPAILHRSYLADHGELKANAVTEFEAQFGIGILYAETGRGDMKGGIEAQHHADHKLLDHKLPGTTRGKQRERGKDHPASSALLNSYEYRREFFQHVIDHNMQEVPDLAPAEMLINHSDIAPTRVNIFHWLRMHQSAEAPRDVDSLRAFALPDVEAVVRKNGVYPLFDVLGSKVVIPRFRYSSPELLATGLLSEVKRTGQTIRTRLKMAQSRTGEAWLPTKDGIIRLALVTRPERIQNTMTIADWMSFHEDQMLRGDMTKPAREQDRLDTLARRQAVELNAAAELREQIAALEKAPSNAALVANMDAKEGLNKCTHLA